MKYYMAADETNNKQVRSLIKKLRTKGIHCVNECIVMSQSLEKTVELHMESSKAAMIEEADFILVFLTAGKGSLYNIGLTLALKKNILVYSPDPTAHAEIQAIRDACRNLDSFQLTDCEVYTSCEPCPMCIGALYWARPKAIYYACTKEDAAEIGFDDQFIYEELEKTMEQRLIKMVRINFENHDLPFKSWKTFCDKVEY